MEQKVLDKEVQSNDGSESSKDVYKRALESLKEEYEAKPFYKEKQGPGNKNEY